MTVIEIRKGLTLVEVLIALAVIAISLVVLAQSQITNLRVTRDAQLTSVAMQFGNEAVEEVTQKVLDRFEDYRDCSGTGTQCAGTSEEGAFEVAYEVHDMGSDYLVAGLMRVDVVVDGPSSVRLSHYVSCMDVDPPPTVTGPETCLGGS